jgi:hypothetical protein
MKKYLQSYERRSLEMKTLKKSIVRRLIVEIRAEDAFAGNSGAAGLP